MSQVWFCYHGNKENDNLLNQAETGTGLSADLHYYGGYLLDNVFSGGECNLDGALGDWQEEVLDCLLYSRFDTLLQLRILLEEEDLGGGGGRRREKVRVSRGNRGFALRDHSLLGSHTPVIKIMTEILGSSSKHIKCPIVSTFTSILLFLLTM